MKAIIFLSIVISLLSTINALYFDLYTNRDSCFIEEFTDESVAIIQYRVMKDIDHSLFDRKLGFYRFTFKLHNDKIVKEEIIGEEVEGKIYYVIPTSDTYEICVRGIDVPALFNNEKSIKFSISIDTNDSIVNLSHEQLPDNQQLKIIDDKVQHIQSKIVNINRLQMMSMNQEEDFSEFQTENSKLLMIMTLVQIGIILGLFLYTCVSLKSQVKNIMSNSY